MHSTSARRLAPRRRRFDDGEEESSITGDVEDGSISEGSVVSDADDDDAIASEASAEGSRPSPNDKIAAPVETIPSTAAAAPEAFGPTTDPFPVSNGITSADADANQEELHFDEIPTEGATNGVGEMNASVDASKTIRSETLAQKSRREHLEYIRERDSNPAFVPNRGGFFLHDDRSNSTASGAISARGGGRGRGRGIHPSHLSNREQFTHASEKPWSHDLHDKHEDAAPSPSTQQLHVVASRVVAVPTKMPDGPPNREFSFSSVLGNVSLNVSFPGSQRKTLPMTKKHHILLPHHRPPLRRDKPVRVSIPGSQPYYIFPSIERSFIFIPRALRPNQQYSRGRGRGRGSFHGSRRTSVYGDSAYTPSVAMSRKSSIGAPIRDFRSPATVLSGRPGEFPMGGPRPVVRMPGPMPVAFMPNESNHFSGMVGGPISYGYPPTSMPMHQPRPQKAVSVAGIESPATLSLQGPRQQQEQPFHQQVPGIPGASIDPSMIPGNSTGHASAAGGTPLSHIPEGAIYANPFQPYPMMQVPIMYGQPYYPLMAESMQYSSGIAPLPYVPPFGPAPSQPPAAEGPSSNTNPQAMNGIVYYNGNGQAQANGQVMDQQFGMPVPDMMAPPTMMNPQAPYYYPSTPGGMYFPTQSA